MAPVNALDQYYLGLTVLVTTAYQLLGFAIAWTFQFDKITDFTGGSNFFLLALLTLLLNIGPHTPHARNIVASVLVMVWATRIAGFLLYRVLRTGSDNRFDEIRSNFLKFGGFWVGQIVWVWTVSLPLTILNSPAVSATNVPAFGTGRDIAGIVLWGIGWLIESIADAQKFRYKMKKGTPKDKPIEYGLWKYSRHPPYFGEMLCWWGIWILCLSPTTNGGTLSAHARAAQYGSVVSPVFTVLLLLFASGMPTAEKPQAKKFYMMSHPDYNKDSHQYHRSESNTDHDDTTSNSQTNINSRSQSQSQSQSQEPEYPHAYRNYLSYRAQTSILVPLPPAVYRRLPRFVKWGLGEWGMYEWVPGRDE